MDKQKALEVVISAIDTAVTQGAYNLTQVNAVIQAINILKSQEQQ